MANATLLIIIGIVLGIALYVYNALVFVSIANKTKTKHPWLAWIPLANNVLMANIAKMHWWPVILYAPFFALYIPAMILQAAGDMARFWTLYLISLVPMMILAVFSLIWLWKIYERMSRPGMWAIWPIIAFVVGMIVMAAGVGSAIASVIGIILFIIGLVLQLAFLGIAAWGKSAVKNAVKPKRKGRKR